MRKFLNRILKLEAAAPPAILPKLIICKLGELPPEAARRVFGRDAQSALTANPPNLFVVPVKAEPRGASE